MRIGIVSESRANERAIHALVEGILSREVRLVARARERAGGVTNRLPAVGRDVLFFHYHAEVDAMIAVFDSDETLVHTEAHDRPGGRVNGCRVCEFWNIVEHKLAGAGPRPNGLPPLRVAVGLAVPAIEAWLHCGRNVHVSERHYVRQLGVGQSLFDARRALKTAVYGNDRPGEVQETRISIEQARRLGADLSLLEQNFPGFALLAKAVRSW